MRESITIDSKTVPGSWMLPNLFVPRVLMEEWLNHKLRQVPILLARLCPDQLLYIASVISSWDGEVRDPSTSHAKGYSIDVAPVDMPTQVIRSDRYSPGLCDNLRLARHLAASESLKPYAIFLEDDHFHLDGRSQSFMPGLYLFVSRHRTYANNPIKDTWAKRMYRVLPSGEVKFIAKLT